MKSYAFRSFACFCDKFRTSFVQVSLSFAYSRAQDTTTRSNPVVVIRSAVYRAVGGVLNHVHSLQARQTWKPHFLTRPEARAWGEQTRRSAGATKRNVACAFCWRNLNRMPAQEARTHGTMGPQKRALATRRLRMLLSAT